MAGVGTAADTDTTTQTQTQPQPPTAAPPAPPVPTRYDPTSATPYIAPEAPQLPTPPSPPKTELPNKEKNNLTFGGGTRGAIGSIATIADSILRGAVQGRQNARIQAIQAIGGMVTSVQSAKDAADAQAMDLIQQPEIKSVLMKQRDNPKTPLTPDEQKTVQPYMEAVKRSNDLNTLGLGMQKKLLLEQTGAKGKSKKAKDGQDQGQGQIDMGALMNPRAPASDRIDAIFALKEKVGNSLKYKVNGYLSQPAPAAKSPEERQNALYAQIDDLSRKPDRTEADNARLKTLTEEYEANKKLLAPYKEPTESYTLVTGKFNGQPLTLQHSKTGAWETVEGKPVDEATLKAFTPDAKSAASNRVLSRTLNVKDEGWSSVQFTPDGTVLSIVPGAAPPRSQIETAHDVTTIDPAGVKTTSHGVTKPVYHNEVDLQIGQKTPHDTFEAIQHASDAETPGAGGTEGAADTVAPSPHPASTPQHGEVQYREGGEPPHPKPPKAETSPEEHTKKHPPVVASVPAAPPVPKTLDETGHIPIDAKGVNPYLRKAANQLLDGEDMTKLTIPQKDRPAAEALAREYGWKGQGLFTPRDQVLLNESESSLRQAVKSPLLSVLNSPMSRWKLSKMLEKDSNGILAHLSPSKALWPLSKQEQDFVIMFNNLADRISGLSQLTRSGRPTESTINRFMKALPNPDTIHSSEAAEKTLNNLLNEIDVAKDKSSFNAGVSAPKVPKVAAATAAPSAPKIIEVSPEDMQ